MFRLKEYNSDNLVSEEFNFSVKIFRTFYLCFYSQSHINIYMMIAAFPQMIAVSSFMFCIN